MPNQGSIDRLAIISDVHGNLTALDAVLDDIKSRGITRILNLGDLVGKGPACAAVVDRCREQCEVIVKGNWDAEIARGRPEFKPGHWHREQLGPDRLDYLAALPGSLDLAFAGKRLRLFHASEVSPFHRVHETASRERQRAMFTNTAFTGFAQPPHIVGYGDIHVPYMVSFDGLTLFNAGSVGNPLDEPLACYAILEGGPMTQSWSLKFVRLAYDIEGEIARARQADMPDFEPYARELRTAVYRGRGVT